MGWTTSKGLKSCPCILGGSSEVSRLCQTVSRSPHDKISGGSPSSWGAEHGIWWNYTPQSCSGLPLMKQTLPAVISTETWWPQPPPASAKLLRSYWGTWLKAWLPYNIFLKDCLLWPVDFCVQNKKPKPKHSTTNKWIFFRYKLTALGIKLGEGVRKKPLKLRDLRNAWSMPRTCPKMKRG